MGSISHETRLKVLTLDSTLEQASDVTDFLSVRTLRDLNPNVFELKQVREHLTKALGLVDELIAEQEQQGS